MENKIRITEDTGFCVIKDLETGHTDIAAYYGELSRSELVAVRYEDVEQIIVRTIVDFITEPDEINCIKKTIQVVCEVIGVVDQSAYIDAMERDDRRQELKAKMEFRAFQLEEEMYYKMLAEEDEEFAELYREYKKL